MAQVAYSRHAYPRDGSFGDGSFGDGSFGDGSFGDAAFRHPSPWDASLRNAFRDADADAAPARAPYPAAMRRARRRARLSVAAALAAAALGGWAALTHGPGPDREAGPDAAPAAVAALAAPHPAPRPDIAWMLDPAPTLGAAAAIGRAAPPEPAFRLAALPASRLADAAPADPSAVREIARRVAGEMAARMEAGTAGDGRAPGPVRLAAADPAPAPKPAGLTPASPVSASPVSAGPTPAAFRAPGPSLVPSLVPLPVARPPELRAEPRRAVAAAPAPARVARALPRTRDVFRAAMAEEPSFLEKLFGVGAAAPQEARPAPRQALAYASPDLPQEAPRARVSPAPSPSLSPSAGTAVYDITARTVTLPSGEVLEAHSGLGEYMDDPRYAHLRMRGPTPPATYELTQRESLFHGVRAIRLNPLGGSGAIHGRDGLLAHTYMLRQPGASNGCVSFRDYDRFLQAFLRGEIRRLVVVAGGGFWGGRIGMADRPGRRG